MSVTEARDRLVKALNHQKVDKKQKIAIQAVGLDASQGSQALAEGREKNCQFVLDSRLTDLQTSVKLVPSMSTGGMDSVPLATAKVEYRLMRVIDGTEYAIGSVMSEDSSSIGDAVLQVMGRVGTQVATDLRKGGNVPHRELPSADMAATRAGPTSFEVEAIDPDFCQWLPTDVPHAGALRGVCEYAVSLPQRMPNFICDQETSRYWGASQVPRDMITALVRYEDGNESYTEIKLNGRPAPRAITESPGQWSTGEFGSNLRAVFDLHNQALFRFSGERDFGGHAAWVFTYEIVKQNDPLWRLRTEDKMVAPPYGGELWIDQKTGNLQRFRSVAKEIPPTFPTQSADLQTDYDVVGFADGTSFVLPVAATVVTRQQGEEQKRNVLQFRNCHKFRAKTRMVLDQSVDTAGAGFERKEGAISAESERELEENTKIYDILREQAVREDAVHLESDLQRSLQEARFATYQKLIALEKERRQYLEREMSSAGGTPSPSTDRGVAVFKVSVSLVPVPVVLRDAKGHVVGSLQKEDFLLFDGGKPQAITSFSIEKSGEVGDTEIQVSGETRSQSAGAELAAARKPPMERAVAYVFDDIHATFGELANSRDAAVRHIAGLRAQDRVAVFTTSGEVGIDFTANHEELQRVLKDLKPHPTIPAANCPPISYYMADQMVNHNDQSVVNLAVTDTQECAFHGLEADNLLMVEQVASAKAFEVLNAGNAESLRSLRMLHDVVVRIAAAPGRREIILVSPGLLVLTPDLREDLTHLVDTAVRTGIIINTLDVRGLYTVGMDASKSRTSDLELRRLFDTDEATAQSDVMAALAYGTGGTFFHNNNDLNEGFRQTADAPEFIYILGFSPQKLDGKFHKLKVTLSRPEKLSIQARQGYYALKPVSVQ